MVTLLASDTHGHENPTIHFEILCARSVYFTQPDHLWYHFPGVCGDTLALYALFVYTGRLDYEVFCPDEHAGEEEDELQFLWRFYTFVKGLPDRGAEDAALKAISGAAEKKVRERERERESLLF
jgi:hypothetical protein